MMNKYPRMRLPLLLAVGLMAGWTMLGSRLIREAPFRSGTDEDISYLAFAVSQGRWPTETDFHNHGVDSFYYPPLYYLCQAPFWSHRPEFDTAFPRLTVADPAWMRGGYRIVPPEYARQAPPALVALYRGAKRFSLGLGVLTLVLTFLTARLCLGDGRRDWAALLALLPAVLLPQFLYYMTLCNNDALCNALGAATLACFAAALLAMSRGTWRAAFGWVGAMALACGLNVLTKTTALVLLPLLAFVCLCPALAEGAWRECAKRILTAAILAAVLFLLAGGWWLIYKAALGDWNSQLAARLAHPWAFQDRPTWQRVGWASFLLNVLRSYIAMMRGPIYGVPDALLQVYLLLPAATLVAAFGLLPGLRLVGWRAWWREHRLRAALAAGLALAVICNLAGLIHYNREVAADHGRLLFPTLAATNTLWAWIWWRALRRRPAALAGVALLAGLLLGGAFSWMWPNRILPAVALDDAHVEPLSHVAPGSVSLLAEAPWKLDILQPIRLPAGRLQSLRVQAVRSPFPQVGGRLEGELMVGAGAEQQTLPLCPCPFGAPDGPEAWNELRLVKPVDLDTETPALLRLTARAPIVRYPGFRMFYTLAETGPNAAVGQPRINGVPQAHALCLAAIYAPP